MKKRAFLAALIFFQSTTFAQTKSRSLPAGTGPQKLEDYFISPAKDFGWMTEKERVSYVMFLYSLSQIIEVELSSEMRLYVHESPRKTSKLDFWRSVLSPAFEMPSAEANALMVLANPGAAMTVATRLVPQAAPQIARARTFFTSGAITNIGWPPWVKHMATQAGFVGAGIVGSAVIPEKEGELTQAATATGPAEQRAEIPTAQPGIDAVRDHAILSNREPSRAQARLADLSNEGLNAVDPSKRDGLFCIFGGYGSQYKTVGGATFCPAPKEAVNNATCKNSGFSPSFLCQNFGLSQSTLKMEISRQLCVPLKAGNGLGNLTARCHEAFTKKFLPTVSAMDPLKIEEIQNQLRAGIRAFEAQRGIEGVGILEYCRGSNSVNSGRQKQPCSSMLALLDVAKKDIPRPRSGEANPQAAPSAPGNTTSTSPARTPEAGTSPASGSK